MPRPFSRVYPRVCGGTTCVHDLARLNGGLSPRVRGNRVVPCLTRDAEGSIPACAGEPYPETGCGLAAAVYPRVCGGTYLALALACRRSGLSPRVRGNPSCSVSTMLRSRSIPACAGEPVTSPPYWGLREVYPRVCGGTSPSFDSPGAVGGLSPRVRGNLFNAKSSSLQRGSIPACAGEPQAWATPSLPGGVYPRVCGGTPKQPPRCLDLLGLSPRVRGNRSGCTSARCRVRSIPACAGEPLFPSRSRCPWWVYPRVCGGTMFFLREHAEEEGLSPRVRGNPRWLSFWRVATRSIPACAGEPAGHGIFAGWAMVYPRVCGGTPTESAAVETPGGLSPRVRGNPGDRPGGPAPHGSIPACAGEPVDDLLVPHLVQVYPRVCGGTVIR